MPYSSLPLPPLLGLHSVSAVVAGSVNAVQPSHLNPCPAMSQLHKPTNQPTKVGCSAAVLKNHASNLKQLGLDNVDMLLVHYSSPTAKKCDCDSQ